MTRMRLCRPTNNDSMKALLPLAAKALILEFEGLDQPHKWPGASSGVSIGRGYDLGYVTKEEFTRDWRPILSDGDYRRLLNAVGLKGEKAREAAQGLKGIRITEAGADKVFFESTMPIEQERTSLAFRGIECLPANAQGALVSLVYNRGGNMSGDRRTEMRSIASAILKLKCGDITQEETLRSIANDIKDMKRLWQLGTPTGRGLRRRRDAEARLVLTGKFP